MWVSDAIAPTHVLVRLEFSEENFFTCLTFFPDSTGGCLCRSNWTNISLGGLELFSNLICSMFQLRNMSLGVATRVPSLQYVISGAPEYSAADNSDDHLSAGRRQQSDGEKKWPLFHISFSRDVSKRSFLSHAVPKASTTAKWIQSTSPTCGTFVTLYRSHYS